MPDHMVWVIGALLFGAAAVHLAKLGHQILTVRMPQDQHRRWTVELEADATALIRARLHVAELECQIASRIGKMPDAFESPAFLAAHVGYSIERAVVAEATRRGLWNPKAHEDLANSEPLPGQSTPPPPQTQAPRNDIATPAAPATSWQNGKLVPFRPRSQDGRTS